MRGANRFTVTSPAAAATEGPAGINWRGAWSVAVAYAAHDGVVWQGSSYVALADVAAGGTPPAGDAVKWLKIAQGGGDIARAESAANWFPALAAGLVDIPGLQINVPANSGPIELEAFLPALQVTFTAGATVATSFNLRLTLEDEANVVLAQGIWSGRAPAANASLIKESMARRPLPNNPAAKTYRARMYQAAVAGISSIAGFWAAGASNEAGAGGLDAGPAFIRARAT